MYRSPSPQRGGSSAATPRTTLLRALDDRADGTPFAMPLDRAAATSRDQALPSERPDALSSDRAGTVRRDQADALPSERPDALPSDRPGTVRRDRPDAPPCGPVALTPESAFDALYVYAAPGLIHQAYLLTGCRRRAFEAADHAFRQAWERWPEVARDPDPVGWVRALTHEYALSPWQRFRRLVTRPGPPPADPLLRALLELPPRHRRTAVLCDGLGLGVSEAAAETEASCHAVRGRLRHARTVLGATPDAARQALRTRVEGASAATLAQPWSVRAGSERRARVLSRTVFAATAALVALIALVIHAG
jgi:DNA-directed RNA polymerase specialized sigma24 family protein